MVPGPLLSPFPRPEIPPPILRFSSTLREAKARGPSVAELCLVPFCLPLPSVQWNDKLPPPRTSCWIVLLVAPFLGMRVRAYFQYLAFFRLFSDEGGNRAALHQRRKNPPAPPLFYAVLRYDHLTGFLSCHSHFVSFLFCESPPPLQPFSSFCCLICLSPHFIFPPPSPLPFPLLFGLVPSFFFPPLVSAGMDTPHQLCWFLRPSLPPIETGPDPLKPPLAKGRFFSLLIFPFVTLF